MQLFEKQVVESHYPDGAPYLHCRFPDLHFSFQNLPVSVET